MKTIFGRRVRESSKKYGDLGSLFEGGSAKAAAATAEERHSRRTVVIISSLLGHNTTALDRSILSIYT
jgi:hypothetical protein